MQFFQAAGGHHSLEGLKQRLDDDTELHGTRVKEKESEEAGLRAASLGTGKQLSQTVRRRPWPREAALTLAYNGST